MKIIIKTYRSVLILFATFSTLSCQQFVDVVPDNVAELENAFAVRSEAQRYLATCYSYIPNFSNPNVNPAHFAGNEFWHYTPVNFYSANVLDIARGAQSIVNPLFNTWDGDIFRALRDCNIFLENIDRVPDMEEYERGYWIAEVNVLKAYYHFLLMRQYGPIPIIRENLPVTSATEETKVFRDPVDDVVDYCVALIDSNYDQLQTTYLSKAQEAGRIIKPVAAAIKAEILLTAASPLFNGNADYASFVDDNGVELISSTYDENKWMRAAEALEDAIAVAEELGENKLYTYALEPVQRDIPDSLRYELNIRNAFTSHWNPEIIWAYTNATVNQSAGQPKIDPGRTTVGTQSSLAPTLEMAELFYSNNGVPIEEDKTYDFDGRFGLQLAESKDRYYIKEGQTTAKLHFNREPRYYGSLGFDRGIWYGNGRFSGNANDYFFVSGRAYEVSGRTRIDAFSVTGLFVKKIVSPTSLIEQNQYTQEPYHWPIYRLSGLYLAYAEALNEVQGNTPEVFAILDRIRGKYGLPGVREAWADYSTNPGKPDTKEGLREIIQRERLIELAFEGQNFWDIRRWKRGATYYTRPTRGFDISGISAEEFNTPVILNNRVFVLRDYLWPISETSLIRNRNLVQNPGW